MAKSKWGAGVSFFVTVVTAFLPISEALKLVICSFGGIGLITCIVGYFLSRDVYQVEPKLDLKVSILGIDYIEAKTELAMHLHFRNDGTTQRTIVSVTFGYRDPDRTWKNSWEFLTPIPGYLGNVQPIRIDPDSERVETYRVVIAHRFREKVGGVIGLLLNATDPSGAIKQKEVEVIEISKPIPTGSNGIAYTGKRAEGVSFDT